MIFIRGLHNLKKIHPKKSIITIGNFDGVHRGHQKIIQDMVGQAKTEDLKTVVIIFEPQPKEYFMDENSPRRIMPLREKIIILKQLGIDIVVCLYFNKNLASLSPEEFVTEILIQKLNMACIYLGEDFKFGYKQKGDINLLKKLGEYYNFQVKLVPNINKDLKNTEEKISSTNIRYLLQEGYLEEVAGLLGRPFCLSGRVIRGDGRGRVLGYPTANINLPHYRGPISGIFAVRIIKRGGYYYGAASMGIRPTFFNDNVNAVNTVLEIYIFNFSASIYGSYLTIEFMHKLRDEEYFASTEALKQQMARDVAQTKAYFGIF